MTDISYDASMVEAYLSLYAKKARDAIEGKSRQITETMKNNGALRVPVDTGYLRQQFASGDYCERTRDGLDIGLGTSAHYSAYQEFGTGQRGQESGDSEYPLPLDVSYSDDIRGIEARSFMRASLYESEDDVKKLIEDALEDLQ